MIPIILLISVSSAMTWQEVNLNNERRTNAESHKGDKDFEYPFEQGYTTYDGYDLIDQFQSNDVHWSVIFNESATKVNLKCSSTAGAMFNGNVIEDNNNEEDKKKRDEKKKANNFSELFQLERTPSYSRTKRPTLETNMEGYLCQKEVVCKPGFYCIWDKYFKHEMDIDFTESGTMGYWNCGDEKDLKRFKHHNELNKDSKMLERIGNDSYKRYISVLAFIPYWPLIAIKEVLQFMKPKTQEDYYQNQWWYQGFMSPTYSEIPPNMLEKLAVAKEQQVLKEQQQVRKDTRDLTKNYLTWVFRKTVEEKRAYDRNEQLKKLTRTLPKVAKDILLSYRGATVRTPEEHQLKELAK